MNVIEAGLGGVVVIEPEVFTDSRGFFFETWHRRRYADNGLDLDFVQDNLSRSRRGVLRGLHFQHPRGQGKLMHVLEGEVFDVAVDLRRGSPTFARWVGVVLSAENHRQLYVPPGFAHGFCVLSEQALFAYKCTAFYDRSVERAVRWDDPSIGIEWPLRDPLLSSKDAAAPLVTDLEAADLPDLEPRSAG